jgi:putative endonuclease
MYFVYILTNNSNRVLYTGVTNDLIRRMDEHKKKVVPGFTKTYNADKLVYYEACEDVVVAIAREKQIKAGSRNDKVELIVKQNARWRDLSAELVP